MSALYDGLSQIRARFDRLQSRERYLVGFGTLLVAGAAIWWLLLAGPIAWLAQAPKLHARADAQLASMQSLAAQAKSIQAAPRVSSFDALKALDVAAKERFGATAELRVVGDRATLTLKSASPQALADFLAVARTDARALPSEVKLQRNVPNQSVVGSPVSSTWDGSLALTVFAAP